jgi:hypothetical protein
MRRSLLRPTKNIFEAIVRKVDYVRNTCELEPLNVESSAYLSDVPMPNVYTNGNIGIFYGLTPNTRVLVATTDASGPEFIVIVGFLPKYSLIEENYDNKSPSNDDVPTGTLPYPVPSEGQVIFRGGAGESLTLGDKDYISLKLMTGDGYSIHKKDIRTHSYSTSHSSTFYSNAGRSYSGTVQRIKRDQRSKNPVPDPSISPLFADTSFHNYADDIGLFYRSPESLLTIKKRSINKTRNVGLAESRTVVNEFVTDSNFTGFLDEVGRANGEVSLGKYLSGSTSREPTSILRLSEHELLEIVSGNLVDLDGHVLDINYQPVYINRDNKIPTGDIGASYDAARRLSRRGVGFHFQLATVNETSRVADTSKNFVFDVDKEGVLKLHVPSSTNTGNIPFPSSTILDENGKRKTSYLNKSLDEPIPVLLRGDDGKVVLPYRYPNSKYRKTGVRYENSGSVDSAGYFPSGSGGEEQSDYVRVNPTVHHNMYAAAERLIANTIDSIQIPQTFVDEQGQPLPLSTNKAFERYSPSGGGYDSTTGGFKNIDVPHYMSAVIVNPRPPAIYPGGGSDVSVAGNFYTNEQHPPYTNEFVSVPNPEGKGYSAAYDESGQIKRQPTGGKSASLIFDGEIDLSIGKDNFDGKSLLLDTAGSVVSWLGKDKNGRSLVFQSDGAVLLNIGGSYTGTGDNQTMNVGRLDIRVNVTDKRFLSSEENASAESDYIISISENGIVIAGMKKERPMILRNDGKILIESVSSDILLKGVDVKTVSSNGMVESLRALKR